MLNYNVTSQEEGLYMKKSVSKKLLFLRIALILLLVGDIPVAKKLASYYPSKGSPDMRIEMQQLDSTSQDIDNSIKDTYELEQDIETDVGDDDENVDVFSDNASILDLPLSNLCNEEKEMTKIFAHRGASGYAPENTMEAFKLAIQQGADGIELDVHLTKDGKVVVIHDDTIDRVSNGRGAVKDMTLRQLRKYSFNNGMKEYGDVKIPLLKDVLELVKPTNLVINIELKPSGKNNQKLVEKVLRQVEKAGMEDRVIYSSFDHDAVRMIHEESQDAETAYLYGNGFKNGDAYALNSGIPGVHPSANQMRSPHTMEQYKNSGLKIRVWTVNDEMDMQMFIKDDVEAIITNYPDKAVKIRERVMNN